ncbi:Uncharacterised protein [Mycobacteroides abscessus subsp. abscessus]|nr:Uncharacterised protein [Mycobacteroides abscessus subsp. abscessus]
MLQQFNNFQHWGLTHIVDVFLISNTKDCHFGTAKSFSIFIQDLHGTCNNILRHAVIDFTG